MTWTKTGDEFPDLMGEVSDAAYRLHHEALTYVNKVEQGPTVPMARLIRNTYVEAFQDALAELVAAGHVQVSDDGRHVTVVTHMEHQIEPEVLTARRAGNARRQRRHRHRKAGIDPDTGEILEPPPTREVTPLRDALPGTGRDGSGRDRKISTKGVSSSGDDSRSDSALEVCPSCRWELTACACGPALEVIEGGGHPVPPPAVPDSRPPDDLGGALFAPPPVVSDRGPY